ncbi:sugar kinase, ribokinase family [Longilinea arvoryzae]|uniref:Sugar kinase, ribokinase family n=1 Tax=Longilinea arvoryzae TaxID=360412 RepID=A0A0S7BIN5_9CHLR|nr:carbohydrate kinase family protein [Longilinea arvoryzae]GAP14216.1 sugar kinase, ribokinase family [Longilinea arvoryzae]
MTIVCTGSIAYDYLMTFPGKFREQILTDKLENVSLSFLVDTMIKQRGGVAPNIAYTLALLGERPAVMGTVGEDFADYRSWLEAQNIDTSLVKVIDGKFTASFFCNTDLVNNQISSFYTGAMANAGEVSLRELPFKADMVVISPNDPGAMYQYSLECQELGIPYLFDPSQQVVRNPHDELRVGVEGAQSLFVNEYEYELLQKHTGLSEQQILEHVKFMVVTCAEKGARIYADGKQYHIPVVPPACIADPTGVGDAFRGGFLRGYDLGFDWNTCGRMGALAATYVLEQHGTQNHHYTPAEFVARYRTHFDDQGVLDALLANS